MAWGFVQSIGATGASGSTLSATLGTTPTTGNKIIVWASIGSSGTVLTPSSAKDGNSNALTSLASVSFTGANNTGMAMFAYDVPATPSKVFTVTFSGSTGSYSMLVEEVSGLLAGNTSAMLDGTAATNHSTTSPVSATYSSTASNEYLVTAFGDDGNGVSPTVPSGYTADTNDITGSFNADILVGRKNSTGGSEANSWTFSGSDDACVITGAFKLAGGGGTAATPKPIVRPRPVRHGGVVWFRRTPPVFTAPTQLPVVRTFVRRNRGSRQVLHELPIAQPPPPSTPTPIVRTFRRRNPGRSLVTHQLPVAYPPGPPIVHTFVRRNRGSRFVTHQLPVAYPPGPPIVHTFTRRNRGHVQVTYQLPVFVSPPQKPVVHSFIRRNRGQIRLLAFPPPTAAPTQRPVVRTFVRRNRGVSQVTHPIPIFRPANQQPVVRTFVRRNRGQVRVLYELPQSAAPPAPTLADVVWEFGTGEPRWEFSVDESRWAVGMLESRWDTDGEASRWATVMSGPHYTMEVASSRWSMG